MRRGQLDGSGRPATGAPHSRILRAQLAFEEAKPRSRVRRFHLRLYRQDSRTACQRRRRTPPLRSQHSAAHTVDRTRERTCPSEMIRPAHCDIRSESCGQRRRFERLRFSSKKDNGTAFAKELDDCVCRDRGYIAKSAVRVNFQRKNRVSRQLLATRRREVFGSIEFRKRFVRHVATQEKCACRGAEKATLFPVPRYVFAEPSMKRLILTAAVQMPGDQLRQVMLPAVFRAVEVASEPRTTPAPLC